MNAPIYAYTGPGSAGFFVADDGILNDILNYGQGVSDERNLEVVGREHGLSQCQLQNLLEDEYIVWGRKDWRFVADRDIDYQKVLRHYTR